jgi:hypothetical protein
MSKHVVLYNKYNLVVLGHIFIYFLDNYTCWSGAVRRNRYGRFVEVVAITADPS